MGCRILAVLLPPSLPGSIFLVIATTVLIGNFLVTSPFYVPLRSLSRYVIGVVMGKCGHGSSLPQ